MRHLTGKPKTAARVLVSAVAVLAIGASITAASAGQRGLADVRHATARFHDVDAAVAAGYQQFLPCFDQPGVGGMGQHFVDMDALDAAVDASHPEALVYEVHNDKFELVAVEYIVPQAAWTAGEPPTLHGHAFHRLDALGIWVQHAWIWRSNPAGIFEDYNPSVRLCPAP
jgi:hypothetical protein